MLKQQLVFILAGVTVVVSSRQELARHLGVGGGCGSGSGSGRRALAWLCNEACEEVSIAWRNGSLGSYHVLMARNARCRTDRVNMSESIGIVVGSGIEDGSMALSAALCYCASNREVQHAWNRPNSH